MIPLLVAQNNTLNFDSNQLTPSKSLFLNQEGFLFFPVEVSLEPAARKTNYSDPNSPHSLEEALSSCSSSPSSSPSSPIEDFDFSSQDDFFSSCEQEASENNSPTLDTEQVGILGNKRQRGIVDNKARLTRNNYEVLGEERTESIISQFLSRAGMSQRNNPPNKSKEVGNQSITSSANRQILVPKRKGSKGNYSTSSLATEQVNAQSNKQPPKPADNIELVKELEKTFHELTDTSEKLLLEAARLREELEEIRSKRIKQTQLNRM